MTVDPARTGGAEVRVVVEAKDRAMSVRSIREELREAKENRAAAVGLVVFSPAHAPAGIAPFDVRAGDVYCVIDPAAPDPATLEAALRLARLLAIASLRDVEAEIDVEAIRAALAAVRAELDALKGIKATLTSIATSASGHRRPRPAARRRSSPGSPRPRRRSAPHAPPRSDRPREGQMTDAS